MPGRFSLVWWGTALLLAGCGGGTPAPVADQPAPTSATPAPAGESVSQSSQPASPAPAAAPPMAIPTISLSGSSSGGGNKAGTGGAGTTSSPSAVVSGAGHRREILEAMDPLQIMLGAWRGTTQKDVGDFKGLDQPNWVWDFKSDRNQPAMVMSSEASPYFRNARLTYLTDRKIYQLVTTDVEGEKRTFEGKFSEEAEKFQGDDDRMHVKYKLELDQIDGTSPRNTWQVVINQQHNNRYLMELARAQGSRFMRFDTVATQREGTSFAKSDDDYGERTCIISGGLGTISVSYKGKSYWVCCTGCKAAFEEDPETWLAEFEAKQKK